MLSSGLDMALRQFDSITIRKRYLVARFRLQPSQCRDGSRQSLVFRVRPSRDQDRRATSELDLRNPLPSPPAIGNTVVKTSRDPEPVTPYALRKSRCDQKIPPIRVGQRDALDETGKFATT